jgi:hypothetical protein
VNCVDPGLGRSELQREWLPVLQTGLRVLFGRSTEYGSRNLIAAAMGGEEARGGYFAFFLVRKIWWVLTIRGLLRPGGLAVDSEAERLQEKVWAEIVEALCKVAPDVDIAKRKL